MTDMVHGASPLAQSDPILPRWWRTLDKLSLAAIVGLFAIGILLGLAASPPLASKNGLAAFHYVERQAFFGAVALVVMLVTSMMAPQTVRRLAVIGFIAAFIALLGLPFFGTDFGKGAVRWYSLGFASVQPSEFLKPAFVVLAAWLLAAGQEINGPPGRTYSFAVALVIAFLLAMQPDFGQAALLMFGWGVMYFVAGAPILLLVGMAGLAVVAGMFAYGASEHFARRIDGFLSTDVDPTTQLGYAANAIREGGLFGVGVGGGSVKWSLPDAHTDFIIAVAAEEYGVLMVFAIIALYALVVIR
ncbi:MAG: FtsW/RodA/SpoVE family cell cycle protein, partial [Shimia sp.]